MLLDLNVVLLLHLLLGDKLLFLDGRCKVERGDPLDLAFNVKVVHVFKLMEELQDWIAARVTGSKLAKDGAVECISLGSILVHEAKDEADMACILNHARILLQCGTLILYDCVVREEVSNHGRRDGFWYWVITGVERDEADRSGLVGGRTG